MRRITVVAASLLVMVGVGSPAVADDDDATIVGNATGGGWVDGTEPVVPPTAAEADVLDAKLTIWEAYHELVVGLIDQPTFDSILASNAAEAHLTEADGDPVEVLRPPPCGGTDNPCPDKDLAVSHAAQAKNYYCGPVSGLMIARYKNKLVSATTNGALTQARMANSSHMNTEASQVTPYSSGNFTSGLNKWMYGTNTSRWKFAQLNNPTVSQFKRAVLWNVNSSMPIGVSTVEWQSDGSYNFHQFVNASTPIGHWIVARGYKDFADKTMFLDPATSVWATAQPRFTHGTSNMVTVYVDNGISAT